MVIVGFLGIVLHSKIERRFNVAFGTICILGLGSVAFHATLSKFSQALDEVPMLYCAFAFLYTSTNQTYKLKKSTQRWMAYALVFYSFLTTYLVTAFEGHRQFMLFHFSFGSAQIYSSLQTFMLYRKLKAKEGSSLAIKIYERGLIYYFGAFACWLADMIACEFVNPHYATAVLPVNPQFHAWWHIFISLGVYNIGLFLLFLRYKTTLKSRKPRIRQIFYVIDYITVEEPERKRLRKQ